jgi:DNA segregation ATPase FtsK/SpoIIIE-like protein
MDATICSLVQNTPSDQLKLVFIDPQKLNFSPYRSLAAYRFTDREGTLGLVQEPADIVSAMVRLDEEHLRRTDLIARTPWGDVEGYNAHAAPEDQLPYVFIFVDELTVLKVALERAQKSAVKSFDLALKSLIAGARKVGFRVFLCLQYLHRNTIPPDIAAQAALNLAFWNSQQGSQNSLGDWAASALPGKGRFIVEGLPGGRQTLQGMYVDRDTVLELINTEIQSPTQPMDELVKNVINYALEQGGQLPESKVFETFGHLTSRRQVGNLLQALERVGLVLPANLKTVPPEPRRLKVSSLDEAANVLKFHPEIRFREVPGDSKLRFGPGTA